MRCISNLIRDVAAFEDSWLGPQKPGNPSTDTLIETLKKHNIPGQKIEEIKKELNQKHL